MAFGKQAEQLAKHSKGDLVSLAGLATQNAWRDNDGNERTVLTLIADSIVSAHTARPGGGRKKQAVQNGFNDPVPSTFGQSHLDVTLCVSANETWRTKTERIPVCLDFS